MSWNTILGHDRLRQSLVQTWNSERLGHAFLFTGPSGIGKRLFAKEFARGLLCENRQTNLVACGTCVGCVMMAAGSHPDFLYSHKQDDKNELPVNQIREIIEQFSSKSMRGGYKVLVLDDADTMNKSAANAFLKTLEEPTPKSILILLSRTDAEMLLPTIRSRCQVYRFAKLKPALVNDILQATGIMEPELRERLVRMCDGSPAQAIALNDPNLWQFRNRLIAILKQQKIDPLQFSTEWSDFINSDDLPAAQKRQRLALMIKMFMSLLQDSMRVAVNVTPIVDDPELRPTLQEIGTRLGIDRTEDWMSRLIQTEIHNDRYLPMDLIIESLADFVAR